MGVSMFSVAFCYVLTMPIVDILKKVITKRGILFFGLFLQSIGVFISGMSKVHTWENPSFFTVFGLCIFGFGFAMVTIPVMPEILCGIEDDPDLKEFDEIQLQ